MSKDTILPGPAYESLETLLNEYGLELVLRSITCIADDQIEALTESDQDLGAIQAQQAREASITTMETLFEEVIELHPTPL